MEALRLPKHQKKARKLGAALIFEDEASFRQDATLHATWSKRGCTPIVATSSNRGSVKVFGCVDVFSSNFIYQITTDRFNAESYLDFLETRIAKKFYPRHVYYIQDNAPYHKDARVWEWFKANKSWFHVKNLPPYCPELNAAENIWHHTRAKGIHNKYFDTKGEIEVTLEKIFSDIQKNPSQIEGYIRPFL